MSVMSWIYQNSKTEIKLVVATLATLFILPAFGVMVVAVSGAAVVGEALANINSVTHLIELFDTNGNKTGEVELSTTWPVQGRVTDEFGTSERWRRLLGLGVHSGIDISGSVDTPITTFLEGEVSAVDNIDDSSCGKNIRLKHAHNITSFYCHLNHAVEFEVGTVVKPGDIIGYLGNTGTSTGPHLHFGTRIYGILVNPRTFMLGEPLNPGTSPTT